MEIEQEVYNLFNIDYPQPHITQSSVRKIEKKLREPEQVKQIANPGRPPEMISVSQNLQINSKQTVAETHISKSLFNVYYKKRNIIRIKLVMSRKSIMTYFVK